MLWKENSVGQVLQEFFDFVTQYLADPGKAINSFINWFSQPFPQWFKSYGHFTEGVDLAYWWTFRGGGVAPAACAAGLLVN